MEFDTDTESWEESLKRPNSEPEKEPKRPKSEPELGSEQEPESKPKPRGSIWDEWYDEDPELSELSIYDDDDEPYIYMCEKYVYKNKLRLKLEAADNEHLERSRGLSEYDVLPRPPGTLLCGGTQPLPITDEDRPTLEQFSRLALDYYSEKNDNQAPTFELHEVVKCAYDVGIAAGHMFYITFQAKPKDKDPSDGPAALTTFQAQVWDGYDESREVIKCTIKI
ncbi:hypothetical protein MTR_3g082420 [Medicago truncatula]|nr:hypothetical protein MTR_3g082420 [Medicago truncatula]AFK37008.1 unknown [Medicago truncatula]